MRNFEKELTDRVEYIKNKIKQANADGIVYGNSGGKDCTLVSILCKKACDNVLGVAMPCESSVNYGKDMEDAFDAAKQFGIETITVDLTATKKQLLLELSKVQEINQTANSNIAPRLRMTTLYTIAQSRNYLVAGTGNRSEFFMGYFTKWGDGAFDFNPISDLTATEVFEFLEFLNAPESIIKKAPSAGLYEGQTDEKEMGVTYDEIDNFILNGKGTAEVIVKLEKVNRATAHKRGLASTFENRNK